MADYYKTTFVVEILSQDEDLGDADLKESLTEAETGAFSGDVKTQECIKVTPAEMAKLLIEQRSAPEFMGLDEHGNELCECWDCYPCQDEENDDG